jgi:UDP-N-acetylglucosamine 3-dehydrogenase
MTVKIGILSFAHGHAYSYGWALKNYDRITFAGVADADAARGRSAATSYDVPYFETEEALLSSGLDGVVITSENIHHRALVEKAVAAGVGAILCEKPLAPNMADARAMVDLCAAKGVRLATAFPCRFAPAFTRLRAQVQSGAVGDVLAIRGTNRGRMPGGWFVEKELSGGGAVIDHTVHVADLNRWLLGREAVEVYAEIGNGFHHQEWEDTGFLTITYEGGIFTTLDTSWSRPKTFPTWGDVTMQVVGTGGVAEMDMFAQSLSHYNDKGGNVDWVNWGSNMDAGLVDEFAALAAGEPAPTLATGEDGLRAVAVAIAAYKSSEIGAPVPVTLA